MYKIISLLLCFICVQAKAYDKNDIYYGQLKNKATTVVLRDTARKDVKVSMYVQASSALENKYNAGVSRLMCALILHNMVRLDSHYSNTDMIFYDEYSQFVFNVPNKEIEIERIISNIFRPILLDSAGFEVAKKISAISHTKKNTNLYSIDSGFEEKVNRALWGDYVYKKAPSEDNIDFEKISYKDVKNFYERFFKPYYTLFIVSGNFNAQDKFIKIDETSRYDESTITSYIPISTLNIYNNLTTSSQYVFIDSSKTRPEKVYVHYQLAGNYQDKNGYVKATILEQALNKISNSIFDTVGITDFNAHIELYKNATKFTISYTPSLNEKEQYYSVIRILNSLTISNHISSTELIQLLRSELNHYSVENKTIIGLEQNIVKSWSLLRIDDFFTYDKKVKDINLSDIDEFYNKQIKDKSFVASIILQSSEENGLLEVDETLIKNTTVFFNYNLSDITNNDEKNKVYRVLQWLLINPSMYIQVNGYADKNEYLKVSDTELDSFVIHYPKFAILSSLKRKSTWKRLDMFRSIKLCKYFIENGVNPNRINGSGFLLYSDEREKMSLNQKVDFTTYFTR